MIEETLTLNYLVFGSVYYFSFKEEVVIKHDLGNLIIAKEHELLSGMIDDDLLTRNIGLIEKDNLKKNPLHFSIHKVDINNMKSFELVTSMVSMQRYLTQSFFLALWIIKDNSINTGNLVWWQYESGQIMSNQPAILFSNSKGEYSDTFYSAEEIKQALNWKQKLISYTSSELEEKDEKDILTNSLLSNTIHNQNKQNLELNENRIKRSIRLINIARSQSFLPAKIASYISSIEALISSNRESLIMQVAERAPKILGGSLENKKENHDKIRAAYGIRNKYVHGDKVTKSAANKLDQVSEDIDSIARFLLIKMIDEYDYTKDYGEKDMTRWYEQNFMF